MLQFKVRQPSGIPAGRGVLRGIGLSHTENTGQKKSRAPRAVQWKCGVCGQGRKKRQSGPGGAGSWLQADGGAVSPWPAGVREKETLFKTHYCRVHHQTNENTSGAVFNAHKKWVPQMSHLMTSTTMRGGQRRNLATLLFLSDCQR